MWNSTTHQYKASSRLIFQFCFLFWEPRAERHIKKRIGFQEDDEVSLCLLKYFTNNIGNNICKNLEYLVQKKTILFLSHKLLHKLFLNWNCLIIQTEAYCYNNYSYYSVTVVIRGTGTFKQINNQLEERLSFDIH